MYILEINNVPCGDMACFSRVSYRSSAGGTFLKQDPGFLKLIPPAKIYL